jgi:hypothetical protein
MSSVVDLALLLVVIEALLLRKRPDLLRTLLAGAGLLVALRLALSGAAMPWVLLMLTVAGACHLLDLSARWRPRPLAAPHPLEEST